MQHNIQTKHKHRHKIDSNSQFSSLKPLTFDRWPQTARGARGGGGLLSCTWSPAATPLYILVWQWSETLSVVCALSVSALMSVNLLDPTRRGWHEGAHLAERGVTPQPAPLRSEDNSCPAFDMSSRTGLKCVEAVGRIIIRGPYPPSNAIIYMHYLL